MSSVVRPVQRVFPCHDPERGLRRPAEMTREIVKADLVKVPLGTQAHELSLDFHAPAHNQAHARHRSGGGSIVRFLCHGAYRRQKSARVQRSSSSAESRHW